MLAPVDGSQVRESPGTVVLQALRGQRRVRRGAGNVVGLLFSDSGRKSGFPLLR